VVSVVSAWLRLNFRTMLFRLLTRSVFLMSNEMADDVYTRCSFFLHHSAKGIILTAAAPFEKLFARMPREPLTVQNFHVVVRP
jgi:hypothetical protein